MALRSLDDLFTPRQLVALTTFSDLVQEARERVRQMPWPLVWPMTGWDWTPAAPVRRPMRMRWRCI